MATVVLLGVVACGGDDGGGGGIAQGMARMVNGASPRALQSVTGFTHVPAADGNWQISPTKIRAPLVGIVFNGPDGLQQEVMLTDCAITFDLTQPGLAQDVTCPFELPAGTYTAAGPKFAATYELLINDAVNGLYTDPTVSAKVTAAPPAGGAQFVTVPNPRGAGNLGVQSTRFSTPLVVNDGDTVSVSVMLNALQALQLSVAGGTVALGVDGNGMAGFPDAVTAVGMPARVQYYVNDALGTPYSYNGSQVGSTGPVAISVMYAEPMKPAFLGFSNANLMNCGPIQVLFVFPGKNNGYLGEDTAGTLGWIGMNGQMGTVAVLRMKEKSNLSETTTMDCMTTTTDPMPSGDSFSSGAPTFSTPTRTDTMTLVAN
jgi:hypothetical protein